MGGDELVKYKNMGILSLFYGILSVFLAILNIVMGNSKQITLSQMVMSIFSLMIMMVLFINLKKFINEKLSFDGVDNIINFIIILNIVSAFFEMVLFILGGNMEELMNFNLMVLIIAIGLTLGLSYINLSIKLKRVYNKGNIGVYSNLLMAIGVLIISFVGINIAELVLGVSYVYLYFIFQEEGRYFASVNR